MRILSLEVSNILSIETASISFQDNGLILVEGYNYDTGRANGAGKTAIFNCLAFALYDKIPRKITASEILRRGSKSGSTTVSVLCGEDVWEVKRSRPKGVQFSKNGTQQDITQEEFELKIRLTYEQFLLTVYVPQSNSGQLKRFLACADADKKKFLLQLLNLEHFNECKSNVDATIKTITAAIVTETYKLEAVSSKIEAYKESLIDATDVTSAIQLYEISLKTLEKDIIRYSNINKPDLTKYDDKEDKIRIKFNEIANAKARRSLLHDQYRKLASTKHEYNAETSCTECGSILDTPERKQAHIDQQLEVVEKLKTMKLDMDACDVIVAKEQAITDLYRKLRDLKNKESSDFQAATLKLGDLRSTARNKHNQLENLRLKLLSNSELLNKIEVLNKSTVQILATVSDKRNELEFYKTLSLVYSPTGAQAYVLDSVVDSFNEVIPKYLDLLSPNMSYILNSYKETSKGDVVAKFSETLTKGGSVVSVGGLSGGEEKGLSICVDFAILEVLETQFGMSLNPIILDEPFDGLDAMGREIVVELLEQLARTRQIFVVDHANTTQVQFQKVLRIELRNDISSIV
jgi:DNA repair exonuclease SbcCD ATPase subunit